MYKKLNFKGKWRLIALLFFIFVQFNLSAQSGKDTTNKKANDSSKVNNTVKGNDSAKVNNRVKGVDSSKINNRVKGSDSTKTNNRVTGSDSTKNNSRTKVNRVKVNANTQITNTKAGSKDNDPSKANSINTNTDKNENSNDIAPRPKKSYPAIIKKLSDLGIPQSMITRIRSLNKREMDSIHGEDYYSNVRDDKRIEYVIKVMLRFVDGRIIGFIKKEPMMHSNKGEYYQSEVDIPVEWCGLDSLKQEHCVKSLEEMATVDSIISIKPEDWHQKPDPGDINTDFAMENNLRLLDSKKGRKQNKAEDLNDSTIAIITNGLSGADSVNALKNYVLNGGKRDKNKRKTAELNDSTIAIITRGLTGLDSLNAIREYITTGGKPKKITKKKRDDEFVGMEINKPTPNVDSLNDLKHAIVAPKQKKVEKKKRGADELDDNTIATITKGLSGEDSMNAIRDYIIEAKHSKNQKKPTRKEEIKPVSDSSSAPVIPDRPLGPPEKKDKKKKGNSEHVIPDIRSEEPEKPSLPDNAKKKIDIRKDDNSLPPITTDSTKVVKPDVPQVVNGRTRIKKETVLPKTDSVINKAAGDSSKPK